MNTDINKIIKLSSDLIKIESTKDKPDNLAKMLEVANSELQGYMLKEFKSNEIQSHLYSNKKVNDFKIILNAHLDVVPGNESQFKPIIKGDKLIGRGAYDMKASAAVEILVFKEVASIVNYPIALQLVTDEEIGGLNGTNYQIEKGVKSDFVIAGESTNFDINNEAKGIYWLKVTTHGSPAHAARPWEGDNAINKMVDFIYKLKKIIPVPENPNWVTTQNLATIKTENTTFNKVPDVCESIFDIRYIPSDRDLIIKKILSILPAGSKYELLIKEPSQFTKPNNKYIKKLDDSIVSIMNKKTNLVSYHGASDIRHYDRIKSAGVCFGPIGAGLHTDNEWVSIKSLATYYKILKKFLLEI